MKAEPKSISLHFHEKHFMESGLPLLEYMVCLVHEQREDYTIEQLMFLFKVSNWTMCRIRVKLVDHGYLQKRNSRLFVLTDKLYPKRTKHDTNRHHNISTDIGNMVQRPKPGAANPKEKVRT